MGMFKEELIKLRESNKQDRATNPNGNKDFKAAVLAQFPKVSERLFNQLDTIADANAIYRAYILRFFFGLNKAPNETKFKVELSKIWKESGKAWAAFGENLVKLNPESKELKGVIDYIVDEKTQDGKSAPFKEDEFVNDFILMVDDQGLLDEELAESVAASELCTESKYDFVLNVLAADPDKFEESKPGLDDAMSVTTGFLSTDGEKQKALELISTAYEAVKDQAIAFPVPYWELKTLSEEFAFLPESSVEEIKANEDGADVDDLICCVELAHSLKTPGENASNEERYEALEKLRSYHKKYSDVIAEEMDAYLEKKEAEDKKNAPTAEELAQQQALLTNLELYKQGLLDRLYDEANPLERVKTAINNVYDKLKAEIESNGITSVNTFNDRSKVLFGASLALTKREGVVAKAEAEAKRLAEIKAKQDEEKKSLIPTIIERVNSAFAQAPEDAKEITLYGVTVPEVLAISAYPYNRDTEHRMSKAHLQGKITSRGQERIVAILLDEELNKDLIDALIKQYSLTPELRSGFLMLVDGHGRCHAWSKPGSFGGWHLERPEALSLAVMRGLTDEQVKQEVLIHGGKLQTLTTEEMAQMANKENKLELTSDFARKSWKSAFKAVGIKEESEGRKKYGKVLEAVDVFSLKNSYAGDKAAKKAYVVVGVKAGILACWDYLIKQGVEDQEALLGFWSNFFQSVGLVDKPQGFTESKQSSELISWIDEKVTAKQTRISTYDGELKITALNAFKSFYEAQNKPKQDNAA